MSEPVQTDAIVEAGKGVAATASGGGLVAVLMEFFRGRERQRVAERLAKLEGRLDEQSAIIARLLSLLDGRSRKRRARKK